jgi:hypothetical protein
LELIALFPDGSRESNDFLDFLNAKPDGFKLLWGGEEE